MSKVIGHKLAINFLDKAILNESLSHAICLVGPEKVGKTKLATDVAEKLIGVSNLKAHPDFFVLKREFDQKKKKLNKNISVDQIRDCKPFVHQRPFLSSKKVLLIKRADQMSIAAANALLKMLEEPSSYVTIILTAVDEDKVPRTILSRSQLLFLSPMNKESLEREFTEAGLAVSNDMLEYACGLPGLVFDWLENGELFDDFKKERARFDKLYGKPFYEKISLVEDLFGDKHDHIETRSNLLRVLNIWQVMLLEKFHGKDKAFTTENILSIMNNILYAKKYLPQNINPRLLVERILLTIP